MELEELKLENEKLNARLNKAVEVFKEQKMQITKLEDENNSLKQNYADKVAKLAEVDVTISNLESDLEVNNKKVEDLTKENTDKTDEIIKLNDTIKKINEEAKNEIDKQFVEITDLKEKLKAEQDKNKDLLFKYETLNNDYNLLKTNTDEVKKQVMNKDKDINNLVNNISETLTKINSNNKYPGLQDWFQL